MKPTKKRLPYARVERDSVVEFTFDGRTLQGCRGDTLASALLANGIAVVGRSFKLHRPRGIMGTGKEETNGLVQLEAGALTEPNMRATLVPLYEGLAATGQNAWPNVRFDLFGATGLFKRLLPASFYYKTFMWPSWHLWEGMVRKMAGLGRAPAERDPQRYVQQNLHADLLVVGAGRSGIEAALEAAADPAVRVLLIDEQERIGGSLLASPLAEEREWLAGKTEALRSLSNVRILERTTASGLYVNNVVAALERLTNHLGPSAGPGARERLWRIFAKRIVLATGAIERPLVFPNNDRPGIMLASAVREYTHRYGLRLGDAIVFYGNNDSAWRTALELAAHGARVASIVDIRKQVAPELTEAARRFGIECLLGHAVVDTAGRKGVRSLAVQRLAADGASLEPGRRSLPCDLLAVSGGWSPTVHLYSQAGRPLDWRADDACFVPAKTDRALEVVGRANGRFREALNLQAQWLTPGVSPERQWVDLQYDVTASDIQLAARENFVSVEHVKRYTTNGMSVDQGKTSNVNGLGILALATERDIPEVGTTRFRPPYHPVTIGAFAGIETAGLYKPYQLLPAHDAHLAAGACFEDYGIWKRPAFYPQAGEDEEAAMAREARAVRSFAGLLDYSSLGKLEIRGADARAFLNRVYINNIETLKVGQARYGLVLTEAGIVLDDGILICLAEDRFLMHTTSGGSATVHQHLERWLQTEWPGLEVLIHNVSGQWATLMLTGPRARAILERLPCDIDLSREAFKHMQYREGMLLDQPCRILRASFTGEVSFEISIPARHGLALWEALMEAGRADGLVPFGIETLMLLRTEKGYLHLGADTDGNTMPQDLGWGGAIAKKPADFIGRRSLSQAAGKDPRRFQFTGIELLDPAGTTIAGAHVLAEDGRGTAGYVTSAFHSPHLGRMVVLGLVAGARTRVGDEVVIIFNGKRQKARLVAPCAYDPDGALLND